MIFYFTGGDTYLRPVIPDDIHVMTTYWDYHEMKKQGDARFHRICKQVKKNSKRKKGKKK